MAGCGCNNKNNEPKKKCPVCHTESNYINYLVVKTVVKDEFKKLIKEDKYYTCNEKDCDVVFFDELEDQIFLLKDISLTADFEGVTKNNKEDQRGGGCKGGCSGGCNH